MIGTGAADGGR